jgi:tyrosyl-tRNA synthetase
MQTEDAEVVKLLKVLTFLDVQTIAELEAGVAADPGSRRAQRALARELTVLVHGDSACSDAQRASEIMFGGGLDGITEALFRDVVGEIPTKDLPKSRFEGAGTAIGELLVLSGLSQSKGQARKDIEGGGIYLNNQRVADSARAAALNDLLFGKYLLLRKGKRTYAVVRAAD